MNAEKLYRKEGNVEANVSAMLGIFVAVAGAVVVLVFVGVLGGHAFQLNEAEINAIGNTVVTNQTLTATNNSAPLALQGAPLHNGSIIVQSGGVQVDLGNFTIDTTLGNMTWIPRGIANSSDLNFTYAYGHEQVANDVRGSILSAFSALKQTGDFVPLIVIAVILISVIGMVLANVGGLSGGSKGGTAL